MFEWKTTRSRCAALFALLAVGITPACSHNDSPNTEQSAKKIKPLVIVSPGNGTKDFDPTSPMAVTVFDGQLSSVSMKDPHGKVIPGKINADEHVWTPTKPLVYGTKYSVEAKTKAASNLEEVDAKSSFRTTVPKNKTRVYFRTSGNINIVQGATYGVGLVVVAHFDEPIRNKALAEKHLSVKTKPALEGSWYWLDNQNAHWRPKNFYPAGTKVTVSADIYGQQLAPGLYGELNNSVSFRIGRKHYAVADDHTHDVKVYDNGKLVRTMPTSMGAGGYTTGAHGEKISLWTPSGIYTVINRANPVIMDSSSYGIPVNSRLGYKEHIYWATQISVDGIYLHQLDSTVWAQGRQNTSHGCLNLNLANAQWFYNWALDGDPVEIINTGGPHLHLWQNGDWSVPWSVWLKGSALPPPKPVKTPTKPSR